MSSVTQVIITGVFDDGDLVEEHLNKITTKAPYRRILADEVGGNQYLQCDFFIAAFNYLDIDELISNIWEIENMVEKNVYNTMQIMIQDQEDELWNCYRPYELSLII